MSLYRLYIQISNCKYLVSGTLEMKLCSTPETTNIQEYLTVDWNHHYKKLHKPIQFFYYKVMKVFHS